MTDGTADHTSGLPDGVVRGEDEGLGDLGAFMREGNLADLSFIDVEGDEEIQKLAEFEDPNAELEMAWGELQTPAIYAEHQKDLTAIPKVVTPKEIEEEVLAEVAMKCARLLHAGANMNQIQKLAFDRLGMDVSELKGDFQYLEEERGLMGNVYVLASAYPNIESGQWNKEIKRLPHTHSIYWLMRGVLFKNTTLSMVCLSLLMFHTRKPLKSISPSLKQVDVRWLVETPVKS